MEVKIVECPLFPWVVRVLMIVVIGLGIMGFSGSASAQGIVWKKLTVDVLPGGSVTLDADNTGHPDYGGAPPEGAIPEALESKYMSDKVEWAYPEGTPVTLTAVARPGYRFDHWRLDDNGSIDTNPVLITTMNQAKTISATFTHEHTLYIDIEGPGTVTIQPDNIVLTESGTHAVSDNQTVTLTATALNGQPVDEFVYWRIDGLGIVRQEEFVIRIGHDTIVEAFFVTEGDIPDTDGDLMWDVWETDLGFNPNVADSPTVDADADGLTNLEEFKAGTDPNDSDTDTDGMSDAWEVFHGLNATSGSGVAGADGDPDDDGITNIDEYNANPQTNPVNYADRIGGYPLLISTVGKGNVTLSSTKTLYPSGEQVILTPVPTSGRSSFSHWEGDTVVEGVDENGGIIVTVTMDSAKGVRAVFKEKLSIP